LKGGEKMEDKIFDLMSKIYSEFVDFKKEVNDRFDEVNKKLDQKADKTDIVRIENLLSEKTGILFDAHIQVTDRLKDHEVLLESLNSKVDNLSIRMTNQESKFEVLVGGKKS
jgi:hypothetical protein